MAKITAQAQETNDATNDATKEKKDRAPRKTWESIKDRVTLISVTDGLAVGKAATTMLIASAGPDMIVAVPKDAGFGPEVAVRAYLTFRKSEGREGRTLLDRALQNAMAVLGNIVAGALHLSWSPCDETMTYRKRGKGRDVSTLIKVAVPSMSAPVVLVGSAGDTARVLKLSDGSMYAVGYGPAQEDGITPVQTVQIRDFRVSSLEPKEHKGKGK